MPDIIKLLPDSIANQIAAGEVIQRPASVVKELMENALDAGADQIQVIVKDAGKTLIQVVDNGQGMSETDARMSFERHATSKIRRADDLFSIRSMGFRGEALASIAAIAQIELKTRQESDAIGTRIVIDGSTLITHEACQTAQGTSLGVKNLFFNVPARRKFLKSDPAEFKHMMDEFTRIALAYPEIAFSLFHNDSEVVILQKSNARQRIVNLLGKKYNEQLVPVSEETDYVEITGFVGKPESAKKARGDQFLFVNRRYIRSPYLHHAVLAAFEEMIPEDAHPMYVIYLEVNPARIDINVHPTKQEIKFEDERLIYNYLRVTIRHALGKYSITPSLDFEQEQAFNGGASNQHSAPSDHPSASRIADAHPENLRNWQLLYEGLSQSQPMRVTQSALLPDTEESENPVPMETLQIHGTFIVAQTKSGMLVVDQQAAHQRILYERYLAAMQSGSGDVQKTLFPETLDLSPVESRVFAAIIPEVNKMGFDIQEFGGHSFVIHGAPVLLKGQNPVEILHRLIAEYLEDPVTAPGTSEGMGLQEAVARAMSLSSALKSGVRMMAAERIHLIETLFSCANPYTSPSGRRCFVILSVEELLSRLSKT